MPKLSQRTTPATTPSAQPQTWRDVSALLSHVQRMADGIGDLDLAPGIQGLIYQATFRYPDDLDRAEYEGMLHREAIEQRIRSLGDRDTAPVMGWYDRPAELRERMVRLIQLFYSKHYEKRRWINLTMRSRSS